MADPLKNVQPGDPLVISAAAWNRLTRAALRAERQPKAGAGSDVPPDDILGPAVVVRVRNATGATLPAHSILTPTADVLDPAGDPLGARRRPVIDIATPASADDPVVIAFDAIEYQKLGRAVAAGVTVANVQVTDTAHRYARPVPGDSTKLTSADSGPAYLLVPPAGTGTALRYVLLGAPDACCGGGSGSGSGPDGTDLCDKYDVRCEYGYLRLYRCSDPVAGTWEYVRDLGVPCDPPTPPGSGPSGAPPETRQITVVTNVCPVFEGGSGGYMTGITVERTTLVLPPGTSVYPAACVDNPSGCCASGSGSPNGCCPDGAADELALAARGPLGVGGSEVDFEPTLTRAGPGTWTAAAVTGIGGTNAAGTSFGPTVLNCEAARGWVLSGTVAAFDGVPWRYEIDLTSDGLHLLGEIGIPDGGTVAVVVALPCAPDVVAGECTDGSACGCAGPMAVTWVVSDPADEGFAGANVTRLAAGGCRFVSLVGDPWSLEFDSVAEVWTLTGPTGLTWTHPRAGWDCCGSNVMTSAGDGPDLTVAPAFACCDGGSGSDPGGDISKCGCDGIGNTLYATFAGALAAYGTLTLTWDGGLQEWRVTPGATACNQGNSPIAFRCVSGNTWGLATSGSGATPSTVFSATATATSCSPLTVSFSGTATSSTGGCVGAWTATVSEVAP